MNIKKDAYGTELDSYLKNGMQTEIVERSDGYIDAHEGVGAYFAPYARWSEMEKAAIKQVSGRVLDAGAGAGRVSLYLQEQGCRVTAIDNSPGAIRVCKTRGVQTALVLPFAKIYAGLGIFDTFVFFGNNFGLFGSFRRARRQLRRMAAMSTRQAKIVAASTDPYKTDDSDHLNYHRLNRRQGRMGGQLRIRIRHKKCIGQWFDYLLTSKDELQRIITGTGWEVQEYIEDTSPSYFIILKKKMTARP